MPLHMNISPLHRLVTIVAGGQIADEEIGSVVQELIKANVPAYAKMIDVSHATSAMTRDQVAQVAARFRLAGDTQRGPVAFINNPDRIGFANMFADLTRHELSVGLFRSIHQARAWLASAQSSAFGRQLPMGDRKHTA